MSGNSRLLKSAAAACASGASAAVAAAWIMLSVNPNTQSRPSIELATIGSGAADVSGSGQYSNSSVDTADLTFKARWARATLSAAVSANSTLTRAPDITFESRWALASGFAAPVVIPDELAKQEIATAPHLMYFAKLTPDAATGSANSMPLPPTRASERVQSVPPWQPQFEITRGQAGEPAPRVVISTPLSSAPEKRMTRREALQSLMPLRRDSRIAVYDISARKVYLPNGEMLEAHSGLGDKMDDPRYVNVRMRGPTPPNVYDLALREGLFHGIRAIRLIPVDDGKMFGRAGMLAHTYMLGPNGQSNGCVSFRDYPKFLQAFLSRQINRLIVVPNLATEPSHIARDRHGRILRYALNNR